MRWPRAEQISFRRQTPHQVSNPWVRCRIFTAYNGSFKSGEMGLACSTNGRHNQKQGVGVMSFC